MYKTLQKLPYGHQPMQFKKKKTLFFNIYPIKAYL